MPQGSALDVVPPDGPTSCGSRPSVQKQDEPLYESLRESRAQFAQRGFSAQPRVRASTPTPTPTPTPSAAPIPTSTSTPKPAPAPQSAPPIGPFFGSKTILTRNRRPAVFGRRITLTANVNIIGHVKGLPRGTVTFTDGPTILGTEQLRRGKATLRTSALPIGNDPIEASYSGNQDLTASRSAIRIETVVD
jgi:hypothetical protein